MTQAHSLDGSCKAPGPTANGGTEQRNVSDFGQIERKLEQLDAVFRQSIRARGNRTNGERVNRRDFASYFSSERDLSQQ
jgi:hypothetical protein